MVRKIIWRKGARADLVGIKDYIARESSLARAEKVVAAIELAADGLADFPYRFRRIPEFNDPYRRETFVYKYRLMYRVEPSCIRILRVVHGQRLLKNVPGSFEELPQEPYSAGPDDRTMEQPVAETAELAVKPKLSPKDEVRALLDRLPDSVTLDDIAYHLDVVTKVLEAESSLERGEGIAHDEVFREFEEKWRGR